ncbi:ABC transporter substrate-binding protein [Candidatus Bipolaricaulota bacterium]|nr:ABC transporter substrate-binding protein [Candidatus Bipolaricaulota bacterium]
MKNRNLGLKVVGVLVALSLLLTIGQVTLLAEDGFVIGFSNGFVNNTWRTQMVEDFRDKAQEYAEEGIISDFIIQNSGTAIVDQTRDIRNMISKGVDALLINPNSSTALNPVIEEAASAGITVISFDQAVTSSKAINVVIDQGTWFAIQAEWLAEQLNGEGDIIVMNGVAGNPANVTRWEAAKKVLDKYPGINVLTVENGGWANQSAKETMSNLLSAYSDIDGVLTQDGMARGIIGAFQAADRDLPVMTGSNTMGFLRQWASLKEEQGFKSYAVANPPGISVSALKVAINKLQGKELVEDEVEDNTIVVPLPLKVTNDNLNEVLQEYRSKPDSFFIDGWLTDEQIDNLFQEG